MRKITVTPNAGGSINDIAPTEGNVPQQQASVNFYAGVTATFFCTEKQFDDSVRPQLEKLASRRIPQVSGGGALLPNTQPLLTWTAERFPGGRPRVHLVHGTLSLGGGAGQAFVFTGANMIPGTAAQVVIGSGTSALTLVATRKGPAGNLVSVQINPPSGAGSVTNTISKDGNILITVVPAAAGPGAIAIAAQIAANAIAALYVVGTGAGTGPVPAQSIATPLVGGQGAGTAFADILSNVAGSYLRVEAVRPGNDRNNINITISAASGAGSVTTVGLGITVVPAAASNTLTAIVSQINSDPSAKLLVKASALGTAGSASKAVGPVYLACGAGETPVLTLAGATMQITKFTDTELDANVDAAAVSTAGAVATDVGNVILTTDWSVLFAGSVPIAA